jgi:hypothetical protein
MYRTARENAMKTTILKMLIPILAGSTTSAFAAAHTQEQGGSGILVWFLIGFGVMVLLFQAAPAMVMFSSMLKGLFSNTITEASFSPQKDKSK